MNDALVSVIVPAYNHERYVRDSIQSVIAQDHANIELVVFNDGSRDKTDEVIRSLEADCCNRFVRYEYISKNNEGVAITLNRGIDWARSEYISPIASDDLMKPGRISRLHERLSAAGERFALAYGDADFIDDDGKFIGLNDSEMVCDPAAAYSSFMAFYLRLRQDVELGKNSFSYPALLRGNYLPAMSMMWRRSAVLRVGKFTPGIAIEDWDLWLRLAREYEGLYVPELMASYRWHASNTAKVAKTGMLEGIDRIMLREQEFVRDDPALAKVVASTLLYNARTLVQAKRYRYLWRLFNIRRWFDARRRLGQ